MSSTAHHYLELLAWKHQNHSPQLAQIHALLLTTGLLSAPDPRRPPTAVYNILIKGCLRRCSSAAADASRAALHLFSDMLSAGTPPSSHTFPSLIKASSISSSSGRFIHAQVVRRGLLKDDFVACCLMKFYAGLGSLRSARDLFDEMPRPDLASCNVMMDALCKNGEVGSAVVLFEGMPARDVISWTTLLNGFVRNRQYNEAVEWLRKMVNEQRLVQPSLRPTEATLVCGLSACANSDAMGALGRGREVHSYIVRNEFLLTPFLGTALVDMYGKLGHLISASNVFDMVRLKNVCTWNVMISALACNGREFHALSMFEKMRRQEFMPSSITFVAVLTACARAKQVDCGVRWFRSMISEFSIIPAMEHYGCMVDLFGRAGLLKEAVEFIQRMPFEPDASVLGALLGACKVHGDVQLASDVGKRLLALQPWHCGRYMVLSNIYAGAGMWATASEVKQAMDQGGIKKISAYSLLDSGDNGGIPARGTRPL